MVRHASTLAVALAAAVSAPACSKGRPSGGDGDARAQPAPAVVAAPRRWDDAMAEVGRRFERAGKAALAGRWELAAYDVGKLEGVFANDLPRAPRPEDVPIDPAPQAAQFASRALPPLLAAARARDPSAFAATFAAAATECNFCHHDALKKFVEVPLTPGALVPLLAPVTPP